MRELYIYWKVEARDGPAVAQALREFHRSVADQGVHARLMVRADTVDDKLTLMEVYAFDSARTPTEQEQQRLVAQGDAITLRWRQGPRHVEVFETVE